MSSMERMRRASGLSLESQHTSFNQDEDMQLQTSMEFTDGGSLQYKGFKINVPCPLICIPSFALAAKLSEMRLVQDRGVQMSPEGPAPMSGISLSDLKFGEILGKGSSAAVRKVSASSLLMPPNRQWAEKARGAGDCHRRRWAERRAAAHHAGCQGERTGVCA
eukprot:1037547-Rhodomonas_salina.1